MLTLTAHFKNASVRVGDRFQIKLPARPSTGYCWQFFIVSGSAARENIRQIQKDMPEQPRIGGKITMRQEFQATAKGKIKIRATYNRPWEGKRGYIKEFTVNVL